MARQIVLLSGHIAAGKTELATALQTRFGAVHFQTREVLQKLEDQSADRLLLIAEGDTLDRRTNGQWVRDALARDMAENPVVYPDDAVVVVDAVRIPQQVEAIRKAFGNRVAHIHLTASLEELRRRYVVARSGKPGEAPDYNDVLANDTEREVDRLAEIADVVLNTERSSPKDVLIRAASLVGLYPTRHAGVVDVVVGAEFGSEGKGNIAAFLAKEYDLLVRVGGPNAGHTVLTESGRQYTHHMLPCGTLTSSAPLLIGPGAVLNVEGLQREIAECKVEVDRVMYRSPGHDY